VKKTLRREGTLRAPLACFAVAASILAAIGLITSCGGGDGDDEPAEATPTATRTRGPSPTTRAATATPSEPPATANIDIELDDFVIRPNQSRAQPGTIIFNIQNVGELEHELVVVRSDLDTAELPRLPDNAGADESELDVVDRSDPVPPGEEAELSLELDVGKYILICNLAPNGDSHYLNGMYTSFEVRTDVPRATTTEVATP
jgi:uncharacterized cupredoxin-like copper-binding protein